MHVLWTLLAAVLITACSGVGFLLTWLPSAIQLRLHVLMFSAAAGFLLGGGFLHLLPDAIGHFQSQFHISSEKATSQVSFLMLMGILLFFLLEKALRFQLWQAERPAHHTVGTTGPLITARMTLLGDALHNFTDGIVLALSFMVSLPAGLATTVAMLAHEIPQELSDVGVLLKGGYRLPKAVWLNFLSALPVLLGAALTLVAGQIWGSLVLTVVPVAAGALIYIALADMLPEMQIRHSARMHLLQILLLFSAIAMMWFLSLLE